MLKFQEVCVDLGLHVVSLQRKSKSLSSYYSGEEIFLLSHLYSWDFYLFHQIELVRLAALSAEMKILGGLSGSCFVYSNSAVFDLNIFPGVWTR